ncbi:hypothetical protein J4573_22890 [Actinomadura barringtoniae]|uniref:Lipoprotein n=1 Tax=Actinomadura barringtoniae TaxID=1427535 RepID=A0A939PBW1_9ACTN|nr:hypothetical protein [Actinomadura barringtoniae]MBO2449967.1 hypothetical protein [Actinomadura barringtoniae]
MRKVILLAVTGLVGTVALSGCGRQHAQVAPAGGTLVRHQAAAAAPVGKAFAVVRPGASPDQVLVARATRKQPAGPETLVPSRVGTPAPVALAPGARIRITAPLYDGELTDWLRGAAVTPRQFADMSQASEHRYGPFPDRARMFDVWLDAQGRVAGMRQIFSP